MQKRPPNDPEPENEDYVTKCVDVEEAVNSAKAYVDRLKTLSRKKKEARETMARAKYHARSAIFLLGKLEAFPGSP
jgi:hypothetical protein